MGGRVEVDVDEGGVVLVVASTGGKDDVLEEVVDTGAGPDDADEDIAAVVGCTGALVDAEATTVGWTTTTAVEARTPEKYLSIYSPYH